MSEEITYAEREAARKEILDMLGTLQKACGEKYLRSDMLTRFVRQVYKELFGLADELRGRIDMLEDQQLRYQGIHVADKQYVVGDIATFRGGLWHCNVTTKSLPGTGEDWRLMAKTPTTARRNRP